MRFVAVETRKLETLELPQQLDLGEVDVFGGKMRGSGHSLGAIVVLRVRTAGVLARQLRRSLARCGLASPYLWHVCFVLTALASVLLASEAARSQTVGPGLVTTPITGNQDRTVVGSTQ